MSQAQPPANIFISYARSDRSHVSVLHPLIRGLVMDSSVFVDTHELRSGERWETQLRQAIAACDVFVVVWSWRARESKWVHEEVQLAITRADASGAPRIIPYLIDHTPLPQDLAAYEAVSAIRKDAAGSAWFEILATTIVVAGLLSAAIFAKVRGRTQLLPLIGLLAAWIAIFSFWALRGARAPWADVSASTGLLLGAVRMQLRALSLLWLGCTAVALVALVLRFAW